MTTRCIRRSLLTSAKLICCIPHYITSNYPEIWREISSVSEESSIVKNVHADDWIAELAIVVSNY